MSAIGITSSSGDGGGARSATGGGVCGSATGCEGGTRLLSGTLLTTNS